MSTQNKVYLFVDIDVKPGQRKAFLEKLKAHGAHIRTEEGCEAFRQEASAGEYAAA